MAFITKNFVSIVAGMLNRMRGSTDKITDFQVGSVARTLIEGPATELDQFYQQMFIGLREAIPVSTFMSFGFELLAAAKATGTVTVSRLALASQPVVIPAGTLFVATDGRRYVSVANVVWAASSLSTDVAIEAETPGVAWNASSGLITSSPTLTNGEIITNGPVTNGRDVETDAEREIRFADYIASISRGTVVAIRYAASQAKVVVGGITTEYVTRVGVDERPGYVKIYLYSSTGVPSATLLADGQTRIDGRRDEFGNAVAGYRAAGVRVDVLAMDEVPVDFTAGVSMFPSYTLDTDTQNAMLDVFASYVGSIQAGETLYIGTLVEQLLTVPGVRQVVPSNTANVACGQDEVLTPGTFTVTAL